MGTRAAHHTPNVITTYSLVCCLVSRWCLWHDRIVEFVVFDHLSYFFDCMDGQMARKYGMITQFGDMYDHSTDILGEVLLVWILLVKYHRVITPSLVCLVIFFWFMMGVSFGCQQRWYRRHAVHCPEEEFLDTFVDWCPSEDAIRWTRFFGSGTLKLVMTGVVVYLHNQARATPP